MKHLLTIILLILTCIFQLTNAQVTYRQVNETKPSITPYDSLSNIPTPNIKPLYGQKILILDNINFYKKPDSFSDKISISTIINKTFTITKGVHHKKYERKVFLEMTNGNDTIYYSLSSNSIDNPSFITLGYFEKQKQLFLNKKFRLTWSLDCKELNSATMKHYTKENLFTCVDVTIIKYNSMLIPSFILRTNTNEEISVPLTNFETNSDNNFRRFILQ